MRDRSDLTDRLQRAVARRYSIERELGRGGMAIVFLAQDLKHGRRIALKVLKPELAEAIGAERFLREIGIAARLSHPNILPLHDSDEADGLLYYVMPFVEGESLRDRLDRQGPLELDDALRVIREVADALGYAHAAGFIHRDIKPENILLATGHAMVSDFGIARAIDAAAADRVTETGLAVGTPAYMSPEQASGAVALDGRSDVYSLGCVAYEMLAGQPPFGGPTAAAILARHALDPVPSLRTVRPTVTETLEQTIARALAKVPADRFATASAFAEALTHPTAPAPPERSIAVLPFADLSGDPANEFFADGVTEDVIAQLSKIRALKVISRTSVMPFKTRSLGLRDIARQLNVATLLEGSVRRAGSRVRIVAQLIDAATDRHLWADTYDRDLTDIFAIQSDVALRIAGALAAELSPEERDTLRNHAAAARAPHPEAYEAYLRGRFHWNQHTPEGFQTALRYFERALEIDPDFSLAHGSIADTWGARAFVGVVAPREAYPMSKAGALKALELDATAAQNHDFLGRLRCWFEWDWRGAELAYQRAIELNRNYADARAFYAWLLAALQRWEESNAQIRQALEMDPLNPFFHWVRGFVLFLQRRHRAAVQQFRETLQLDPGVVLPRLGLWSAFHHLQRPREAFVEAQNYFVALKDDETSRALASGFDEGGYAEAMRAAGLRLAERFSRRYTPPTLVARLFVYAGERDLALRWVETAFAERDFPLVYCRVDPTWDALRDDRRFADLLERMNFPPPPADHAHGNEVQEDLPGEWADA